MTENEEAIFHTKSGLLTSKKTANGGIELNFPIEPNSEHFLQMAYWNH